MSLAFYSLYYSMSYEHVVPRHRMSCNLVRDNVNHRAELIAELMGTTSVYRKHRHAALNRFLTRKYENWH